MEKSAKIYINVRTAFDRDGRMRPLSLEWEDGRVFPIDRVGEIHTESARFSSSIGDRYTVWIHGCKRFLFFERSDRLPGQRIGRWFMERKLA